MNMDLEENSTFSTTQISLDDPKISESTTTKIRQPKRSAKSGPAVDYTRIYTEPQYSSVAPAKDVPSLSVSPLKNILYRQAPQEVFSVSDQLTPIEHRLPSIPTSMEWSSTSSIEERKEQRRAQLKEGKKKFMTHQTEQAKEIEKKLHSEKMVVLRASLGPESKEAQRQKDAQRIKQQRATMDAQIKAAKRKSDAERKTKYKESMDPQQRSIF